MKKFRADKKAKEYKNIDAYLEAVWKKHKDVIEKNMIQLSDEYKVVDKRTKTGYKTEKARWKRMVKEMYNAREYDETLNRRIKNIDEAIDKATRSTSFSYDFREKMLIEDQLKYKSPATYKEFKQIIGRKKIKYDELVFMGYGNNTSWYMYSYEVPEKIFVERKRGYRVGEYYARYTGKTVQKKLYLVYHFSPKGGNSAGWYEIQFNISEALKL